MQIKVHNYSTGKGKTYRNIESIQIDGKYLILDYGNGVQGSIEVRDGDSVQIKESSEKE